jgi:hypothetical protein
MTRERLLEERIRVEAGPTAAYRVISDLQRMGELSPECRGTWKLRGRGGVGTVFLGLNRRGVRVWFTTCVVTTADEGSEFAFRVSVFGLPIALWGYRFHALPSAAPASAAHEAAEVTEATEVTEYWQDLRTGRGARLSDLLGVLFAGTDSAQRIEANRTGMQTTLSRLKAAVEGRGRVGD